MISQAASEGIINADLQKKISLALDRIDSEGCPITKMTGSICQPPRYATICMTGQN